MDVDTDVLRFLKHLESERRLSPRTVVSYRKDLEDLRLFLDDHYGGGGWGWGTVERIDFRAFMGWCGRKGLSRRTVARKLSAIRTFYRFLHLEDRVPSDPARTLRSPRIEKRLPGHATSRNIDAVFSGAEARAAENTFRGTRNLVILELLYGSGLRLSELHGLDLSTSIWDGNRPRCWAKETGSDSYPSPARRGGRSAGTCLAASNSVPPRSRRDVRPSSSIRRGKTLEAVHPDRGPTIPRRCGPGRGAERACSAPQLRHAPSRRGRGPHGGQGASRSRVIVHDAGVHAHIQGAAAAGVPAGHIRARKKHSGEVRWWSIVSSSERTT